jgi:hypothetical protein
MWSFFDRLVNVALPRTRDFRGTSPDSFDGRGNYTLGIREQLVFPEIEYDKIDKIRGFEVTLVTSAPNDEQGRMLLALLGMPFRKSEAQEVQGSGSESMPDLRPAARLLSPLPAVPHLPARTGAGGEGPGPGQVILVACGAIDG